MKCVPFVAGIVFLVGCSGTDPASLVRQVEMGGKIGADMAAGKRAQDAAGKLVQLGAPAIPAMIEGLGSSERFTIELLAPAFAEIGEPAVAPLTAALADKNARRRKGASDSLHTLWMFGRVDINSAVPALKAATTDSDAGVRKSALSTLRDLLHEKAAPLLIAALNDPDIEVRRASAQFLGIGQAAGKPALVVGKRLEAMGVNKPLAPEAIPALIKALNDDDAYLRLFAAKALGKFGSKAKAAVPRIAELLEDSGEQEGRNGFGGSDFADALVGIGPDAIGALTGLLQSKKPDVRARVELALQAIARNQR